MAHGIDNSSPQNMRNHFQSNGHTDTSNVDVLTCPRLPARLFVEQVALLLGFQVYELLLLIRSGHLKCLGSPSPNSTKHFSSTYILQIASDPAWLSQATKTVALAVREKNGETPRSLGRSPRRRMVPAQEGVLRKTPEPHFSQT